MLDLQEVLWMYTIDSKKGKFKKVWVRIYLTQKFCCRFVTGG